MRRVNVHDATETELDWMVGELEFRRFLEQGSHVKEWVLEDHRKGLRTDPYSTSYAHGSPIIEREGLTLDKTPGGWVSYMYREESPDAVSDGFGPTHLIAALRCYVAAKLGEEVEVPDGIT